MQESQAGEAAEVTATEGSGVTSTPVAKRVLVRAKTRGWDGITMIEADQVFDEDPEFDEENRGHVALLEEDLARELWREKDEQAVTRAVASHEEARQKQLASAGR